VTGRALHPVEAIRREVEAIGAERLDRRVPEPDTADGIGRLARTMNAMLGRLEEATDRQRRFVADASHELRTPLTDMRGRLDVDLAHPDVADWQDTEREVLDDAIALQRLVDDLLVLAAADASAADSSSWQPVDLDEIVPREARRMRSRSAHRVDSSSVSGAQLVGNANDLARAVRNLLDNADRHARSAVTVALAETDDEVALMVSDDGPGIPDDRKEWIFERFTRLDDAALATPVARGWGWPSPTRSSRWHNHGRQRPRRPIHYRTAAAPTSVVNATASPARGPARKLLPWLGLAFAIYVLRPYASQTHATFDVLTHARWAWLAVVGLASDRTWLLYPTCSRNGSSSDGVATK
jgi:HAMP domain-containing protein